VLWNEKKSRNNIKISDRVTHYTEALRHVYCILLHKKKAHERIEFAVNLLNINIFCSGQKAVTA
jgi:hypothetical protein